MKYRPSARPETGTEEVRRESRCERTAALLRVPRGPEPLQESDPRVTPRAAFVVAHPLRSRTAAQLFHLQPRLRQPEAVRCTQRMMNRKVLEGKIGRQQVGHRPAPRTPSRADRTAQLRLAIAESCLHRLRPRSHPYQRSLAAVVKTMTENAELSQCTEQSFK